MNKNKSAKINWYSKKHGITLISLVITIVVMLILAGVAISITVGDGSVTQHAENAAEKWGSSVANEQIKMLNDNIEIIITNKFEDAQIDYNEGRFTRRMGFK